MARLDDAVCPRQDSTRACMCLRAMCTNAGAGADPRSTIVNKTFKVAARVGRLVKKAKASDIDKW